MTLKERIHSEAEQARRYESISTELSYIESGIQRAQASIYQAFGIVLPVSISAIGLILSKEHKGNIQSAVPLVFIVLVTATIIWTCCLWMELLRYYRYKYVSLLPELYSVSCREEQRNMMVFLSSQGESSWMPAILLNLSTMIFLVGISLIFYAKKMPYLGFSGVFMLLATASVIYVLRELRSVQRAACRAHDLRDRQQR